MGDARNQQFVVDISRWVAAASGRVDLVVQKVLFDLAAGVIRRTPVDTGRLKANWQFGIGEIPSGTTEGTDTAPVGSEGSTERGISAQIATIKAGTIHYLVNGLPYAPVIEYGLYGQQRKGGGGGRGKGPVSPAPRESRKVERDKRDSPRTAGGFSIQAPQGMVRITIVEYKSYLENAINDVRGS